MGDTKKILMYSGMGDRCYYCFLLSGTLFKTKYQEKWVVALREVVVSAQTQPTISTDQSDLYC
jgi:hypothetical protein